MSLKGAEFFKYNRTKWHEHQSNSLTIFPMKEEHCPGFQLKFELPVITSKHFSISLIGGREYFEAASPL